MFSNYTQQHHHYHNEHSQQQQEKEELILEVSDDYLQNSATSTTATTITHSQDRNEDEKIIKRQEIEKVLLQMNNNDDDDDKEIRSQVRQLATSKGGLMNASYRQQLWPLLLVVEETDDDVMATPHNEEIDCMQKQKHQAQSQPRPSTISPCMSSSPKNMNSDKDLIKRDVGRSVIFRYNNSDKPIFGLSQKKKEEILESILIATCCGEEEGEEVEEEEKENCNTHNRGVANSINTADNKTPVVQRTGNGSEISYYQGLHDISGVIMINLDYDKEKTIPILKNICRNHLQDICIVNDDDEDVQEQQHDKPAGIVTMRKKQKDFSNIIYLFETYFLKLIKTQDQQLYYLLINIFQEVDMNKQTNTLSLTNILLPWYITWFTHIIHDETVISHLMDVFITHNNDYNKLFPFYFIAALICNPKVKQYLLETAYSHHQSADNEYLELYEDDPFIKVYQAIQSLPSKLTPDFKDKTIANNRIQETMTLPVQDIIDSTVSIMDNIPMHSLAELLDYDDTASTCCSSSCSGDSCSIDYSWSLSDTNNQNNTTTAAANNNKKLRRTYYRDTAMILSLMILLKYASSVVVIAYHKLMSSVASTKTIVAMIVSMIIYQVLYKKKKNMNP